MSGIIPNNTPQATYNKVLDSAYLTWIKDEKQNRMPKCFAVGVRGYYEKTMGDPTKNDRGIYDDAIFVFGKDFFASFNANVDPSRYKKGVASLIDGVHWYKKGIHGLSKGKGLGYPAFRPATPDESLRVTRDGSNEITKGIAINIHRGSYESTSSLGCQTIPPDQWLLFYNSLCKCMDEAQQETFPYILTSKKIA